MLQSLSISNYAIIQHTQIKFDKGLNIITGETGAGKSILMGALGLILGDRADTKVVMQGSEKCVVEASFNLSGYELHSFFEQQELDDLNPCLIRREITSAGKSRAFINDTPVTLQVLRTLGLQLIDIVSQHQTLELNESSFQLQVVDAIAETIEQKLKYQEVYKNYKQAQGNLAALVQKEAGSRQDEDYLRFVLNELQELNPKEGEQEILETRLDELSNAESIQQAASQVNGLLEVGDLSLIDRLREAKTWLSSAAKHHHGLQQVMFRLDSSIEELKDIAQELQSISEQTLGDPQTLAETESRLQQLFHLQKKHKVSSSEELIVLQHQFEQQFEALGSLENEIAKATLHLENCKKKLLQEAELLSKKRAKAIPQIEAQVNALFVQVALPNAVFSVQFEPIPLEKCGPDGADELAFLFSANRGFAPQPINKVASGGELSRLMLCIKSLIADKVQLPSIVFDEIDTGISGEAAQKVAILMQQHAQNHQVIAITHLPQIAGKAQQHLYVYKQLENNTTQTRIKSLQPEERVEEIARMLSGENPSEKVLAAARELMGE
jgi:DNA repair protein RecN (Recombination protein N)